jgi:hypothetical protein
MSKQSLFPLIGGVAVAGAFLVRHFYKPIVTQNKTKAGLSVLNLHGDVL